MRIYLKRIILGLLIIIAVFMSYFYQQPIMGRDEAVLKAAEHLQILPDTWGGPISLDIMDIPYEDIHTSLKRKDGFINELTNRMQWEITIKYKGKIPTVVMDAYTGKFITVYGPLN